MTPSPGVWEHDLRTIWANLSVQNAAEVAALGLKANDLIAHLVHLGQRGYCEIGLGEGETIDVAFGVNLSPGKDFSDTWFLATQRFFDLGTAGIRYMRGRCAFYHGKFGLPLRSTSYSPLPEAAKWFRVLGFSEAAPTVDGGRVFVYS